MNAPDSSPKIEQSLRSVLLGLISNVVMAAVKIIAGLLGHSYALIADGIESTMDIFSSVVVLGGLKIGSLPADEEHPYGHGKAESLAAMIVSLALLTAGICVAIQSVREILQPHRAPAAFTLIVLLGIIATKEIIFRFLFFVGKAVNSSSIQTEAWHQRSDALTSIAAFIGISIALIGGKGYESADSWAALAASGIIAFNGINLLRHATKEVMDYAPDPQTEETIRIMASQVPGVAAIEKCKVRKSGLYLFVDLHVEVNGNMRVHEAHDISHRVKDTLMASDLNIKDVLVHIEPARPQITSEQVYR